MIGIDIEQFTRDPYGSGIQRVLQYLAIEWPDSALAHFLAPDPDREGVLLQLPPHRAAELLSLPFAYDTGDLREAVRDRLRSFDAPRISASSLPTHYDRWLLPEVSYLPAVIERFEAARASMRTAMIGYDTLPMTEPGNYRFTSGMSAWVSEYFRLLAVADAVVCISASARDAILGRLRRPGQATTVIAHPGGDHIPVRAGNPPQRPRFCRVGTMEARKRPVEILDGFLAAVDRGLDADLLFIGRRSPSTPSINARIDDALAADRPVVWVEGASDALVLDLVNSSSAFLSIGIEGYGIPVLEAIRLGVPVAFDGTQPAADLMVGRGAFHVRAGELHQLCDAFFSARDSLPEWRGRMRPDEVPTWRDFVAPIAAIISG